MSKVVSSFWYGDSISDLERMCMKSFIQSGYEYNLYVYNEHIENIPGGVSLKDASEILEEDKIFFYQDGFNSGSVSGFANIFRYCLLAKKGGIWVDTDVCLVSDDLKLEADNVFVKEGSREGKFANCIMKSRKGGKVVKKCINEFENYNKEYMGHGETGPELLTDVINNTNLDSIDVGLKESGRYFPFLWNEIENVFYDNMKLESKWITIHFWNAWLRERGVNKNGSFLEGSVYERLKNKYLK